MKYVGQFRNINEELITVTIITNNDSSTTKTLLLAEDPVTLTMDSDSIFSPIKSRSATISILSETYYFDMYSSTAQGTKVTISNDSTNTILFNGYLTPNTYNQDYVGLDNIELEAVEALSTLEYYNYSTDYHKIVSFYDLIKNCLVKCNAYNTFYVSNSLSVSGNTDILTSLYINDNNFFDSDDEKTPWKLKELLEEICQFLGYTCTVYNNEVYFIDYNCLNEFQKYDLTTDSKSIITVNDVYNITSKSYRDNNTTISLDETYNQISIKDNFYFVENLIPDLFDEGSLVKLNAGDYLTGTRNKTVNLYKFYNNTKYNFFKTSEYPDRITTSLNLNAYKGSYDLSTLNNYRHCVIMKNATYKQTDVPSSIVWNNMICLNLNPISEAEKLDDITNDLAMYNELITLKSEHTVNTIYHNVDGAKTYILVKCSIYQNDEFLFDDDKQGDYDMGSYPNLTFRFRIGDRYYAGKNYGWLTLEEIRAIFDSLPTEYPQDTIYYVRNNFNVEGSHHWWNWNTIANDVTYDLGIDGEGVLIPITNEDNLSGQFEFTLINNGASGVGKGGEVYRIPKYIFFKNLSVSIVKQKMSDSDADDTETDVKYVNVIDEEYVNEYSDMTFRINSATDKGISYSSVIYKNNVGNEVFLNEVYDKTLDVSQLQELNIIEKHYNHYNTPKTILELTIENKITPITTVNESLLNKSFILDSYTIDVANNKITSKLIEL